MTKVLSVATMALILSGSAFAASTITYTVELGGDPHEADWENFLNTPYTAGTTDPGYTVSPGANGCILNWAVRVDASGTVLDAGQAEIPVFGAANVVFSIEVRDSNGDLVAALDQGGPGADETGFFSVINDGDGDGIRGSLFPDELHLAAFAIAFDADLDTNKTGRLIDPPAADGPNMERYQYPSTAGFPCVGNPPVCATADGGTLVGMGAGYAQFQNMFLGGQQRAGVGVSSSGDCDALGNGPIAEGQINLANIPNGTYTIHVVPGNGNNVLRGDFLCAFGTEGAFAQAADNVDGDSLDFVVDGCGAAGCDVAPAIVSAVSRKMHGAQGPFDVDILAGQTEPRFGGTTQVVVTFDRAVAADDGTLDTEVLVSSGTISNAAIVGDTLTINMSGALNLSCLQITLTGIACDDPGPNQPSGVMAPTVLGVRQLYGDANGDGQVASGDITQVKQVSGQVTTGSNFRRDLNADGQIASGDITIAKQRSGNVATPCLP